LISAITIDTTQLTGDHFIPYAMTKAAKASGVKKVPKTPWTKKENPLLNAWAQE